MYRPPCRNEAGTALRLIGSAGVWLLLASGAAHAQTKAAKTEPVPATQLLPPGRDANAPPKQSPGPATGLPVPRFVSLKSGRINVRRGPGDDYPIEWVFEKKGLPVEITAESDRWRRIRDREGDIGWVWHSMLDGRRTAIVENKSAGGQPVPLHAEPNASSAIVAYAEPGVIAQLAACKPAWCELKASGYEGWIERPSIWGIYANETFE
jgi:SH3-like domain-containing protein